MEISQLQFYSRGVVVTAKERGSNTIQVTPIEYRFMSGTSVSHIEAEDEVSYQTGGGDDVVVGRTTNAVPCRWLSLNSNRITPPDVQPKDEVLIWRMGDTDIYYWQDFNQTNVKRLEDVTLAWSGDPNAKMKDDLSNAYHITISTIDGHVTFQTSQANGEPFAFTAQFNTAEGIYQVTDDTGTAFFLDSKNTVIGLQNNHGTYITVDKNNIFGYAPDSINLEALKLMSLKTKEFKLACETYDCKATDSHTTTTKAFKLKTDTMVVEASDVKYQCPSSLFTGKVTCASLSVGAAGSAKGAASCVVKGDMTVDGNVSVTQTLTASKIVTDDLSAANGHIGSFSHGGPPCC